MRLLNRSLICGVVMVLVAVTIGCTGSSETHWITITNTVIDRTTVTEQIPGEATTVTQTVTQTGPATTHTVTVTTIQTVTQPVTQTVTQTLTSTTTATPPTTTTPTAFTLYLATRGGIVKVSADGSQQVIIAGQVDSSSIEIFNNRIYISDSVRGGNILVYDLNGAYIKTIPTPSEADEYHGFVVLPDERITLLDNVNDKVYFIDSSGTLLATTNISATPGPTLQNLDGIVVDNRLIFSEDGYKRVLAFDLNTYEKTVFKDLSNSSAFWLGAITYANGQYYICSNTNIYSFTEIGTITTIAELGIANITSIVIADGSAYVSINFTGQIWKVDLSNGTASVFASGLDYPVDMEIE